jgi:hypothetical protein
MAVLIQIQEFLNAHIVRLGFITIGFIYLLSGFGFWMERFTIMITSFHRDYLPAPYTSEISFILSFYLLTIAQCLLLAVIFVHMGTWIKWYNDKRIIKNHIFKQQ